MANDFQNSPLTVLWSKSLNNTTNQSDFSSFIMKTFKLLRTGHAVQCVPPNLHNFYVCFNNLEYIPSSQFTTDTMRGTARQDVQNTDALWITAEKE